MDIYIFTLLVVLPAFIGSALFFFFIKLSNKHAIKPVFYACMLLFTLLSSIYLINKEHNTNVKGFEDLFVSTRLLLEYTARMVYICILISMVLAFVYCLVAYIPAQFYSIKQLKKVAVLWKQLIWMLIILISIGLVSCGYSIAKKVLQNGSLDFFEQKTIVKLVVETMDIQRQIEEELHNELQEGIYNIDNPMVVVDPYGVSPLTALVLFKTEEPSIVSVHISGDTEPDEIDFEFDGYVTEHHVPIYGLYADRTNSIEITVVNKKGDSISKIVDIVTEPLPQQLEEQSFKLKTFDADKYCDGFNILYFHDSELGNMKAAFDSCGEYRWIIDSYTSDDLFSHMTVCSEIQDDGTMYISCINNKSLQWSAQPTVVLQIDLCGKILNVLYSDYGNHHDIYKTQENTLLLAGNNIETTETNQDFVYEFDLSTGEIINTIDYKDVLLVKRNKDYVYNDTDWCHLNSIVCNGDDMIVSSNYQSTVLCTDRGGTIKWMLCGHDGYPAIYWDKILTPIGDNFEYCYSQHNVSILPDNDNNPDTIDILLFDNGRTRNYDNIELQKQIKMNLATEPLLYSRMVVYRINEKDMTVEQIWTYGKERTELFAPWQSSAQYLENGNYYGMFRVGSQDDITKTDKTYYPAFVEVDSDGNLVWECHMERSTYNLGVYRAYRKSLYGNYKNTFDITPVNLIPESVLIQNGCKTTNYYKEQTTSDTKKAKAKEDIKNVVWSVEVLDSEYKTSLHSTKIATEYLGAEKQVQYDNVPSEGKKYLLLKLKVAKQGTGTEVFSWDNVKLVYNDKSYYRIEDSFISSHGYERLPNITLTFGSKTGWVCFEVPTDFNVNKAELVFKENEKEYYLSLK